MEALSICERLPLGEEADGYVAAVTRKYAAGSGALRAAFGLVPVIEEWAGTGLRGAGLAGSYAKGTATSLGKDVDLFVSLWGGGSPGGESRREGWRTGVFAPQVTVRELYWSLLQFCARRGLRARAGNVSVQVEWEAFRVDLVPGRFMGAEELREGGAPTDTRTGVCAPQGPHTLYRRRTDTWIRTDVGEHIRYVMQAGAAEEIRALKIWRERWGLRMPSFLLELVMVEAGSRLSTARRRRDSARRRCTAGKAIQRADLVEGLSEEPGLAARVRAALGYLAEEFVWARVVDPANGNNVVSEELDMAEKRAVQLAAQRSLKMERWERVLW